jgi:hypothetical protein
MQLHAPALGVLVANPRDVPLLPVEASEGQRLEGVHGLLLLRLARGILKRKGQHPVGVGPLSVDAVDQLARPVHVAPHHLGRRMVPAFAIRAGQILRDLPPAAAASLGELNPASAGLSWACRIADSSRSISISRTSSAVAGTGWRRFAA